MSAIPYMVPNRHPTTEQIIASKIMAKAISEIDGKIFIFVIFQLSYEWKYFFIFTAKSRRSPRKSWKLRNHNIMRDGRTFPDIIARYGGDRAARIIYPGGKRNTARFLDQIQNPPRQAAQPAPAGGIGIPRGNFHNRNRARKSIYHLTND